MVKGLSIRDVVSMCQRGRAKTVRKNILNLLSSLPPISKTEQKSLLDGLLYVELFEGCAEKALHVLKRRRTLGYRDVHQRMDAVLQTCTLLYNTGHFIKARAELTELLCEKRSHDWHGLLFALSLYVDVDKKCRELMTSVLIEASGLAIKKLGIPISVEVGAAKIPGTISAAHKIFCADSKMYSGLLIRVFTKTKQDDHLIEDLCKFSENAKVRFFRKQAKQFLSKLKSQNKRADFLVR